jgi:hypothetical protein
MLRGTTPFVDTPHERASENEGSQRDGHGARSLFVASSFFTGAFSSEYINVNNGVGGIESSTPVNCPASLAESSKTSVV